ncbi:hypothetical protein A2966_00150 [Candidatus Roizmanbacteria bacterium RIFCSPLOWO2_01_FULL_41_22]|uniref:Polyprenyl synthetase n=2 Tax=Candidatus Roizmaniibacteriota TaxID=1752723 RepID=A0A1F7JQV7_9BACT|nr:MAG: hypothetical protein A2966_00150 [Candidatus Roizmanbacteria bacterium RIFCSPLOWO2_01_FULL_41_22]OGK57999.1 MAG: hypothetical protein A3H86_00695 [Candidatus Roizmanbacteria bacterium RIFCSPLOWO2_02_FULL_41_9]
MTEAYTGNISIKDISSLSTLLVGAAKTRLIGGLTTAEKGLPWPLSGTFLLPFLETVGKKRTPLNIYPLVSCFYYYIRATDDFLDQRQPLASWEETQKALDKARLPWEMSLKESSIDDDQKTDITNIAGSLGESIYQKMREKEQWSQAPSFTTAYNYRLNTTGLLSEVVADIWCIFAGVPENLRFDTIEATRRLGMVFQFRDDLFDIKQDSDMDGNLTLAILTEENERNNLFASLNQTKTPKKIMELMKKSAPRTLRRNLAYIEDEMRCLRERSPEAASQLSSFIKLVAFAY